jgi:hypothetical protein
MQNMDFHTKRSAKNFPMQLDIQDPEYFTRLSNTHHRDEERNRKRASRMMSFIIALCIISFTAGLVIGIKFASGSRTEIVDEHTRRMMSDIGNRMSSFMSEEASAETSQEHSRGKNVFPREEYPFAIRLGSDLDKNKAQEIAAFLSGKGHTVILSKNNQNYRLFIGPFKEKKEAEISLKKITAYPNKDWFDNATIVKR